MEEPSLGSRNGGGRGSERFYGWTMLGVAWVMAASSMPGQSVLLGLFNEPIQEGLGYDPVEGLKRVSGAYTLATVSAGFLLPLVGRLADRLGLRLVVGCVTALFAGGLVLLSFAENMATVTAGFFLCRLFGQGSMGMLAGHVIAMWFERRLGTAHAVMAMGFAIPSALSPIPTEWLIEAIGWRNALLVLAGVVVLMVMPLVLTVFRNKPEDVGQHLDGDPEEHETHDVLHGGPPPKGDPGFTLWQAMGTRAFWIVLPIMAAAGMIGTALIFQMKPVMEEAGSDTSKAALTVTAWAVAGGITSIVGGRLADSVRPSVLLAIGPGFGTLACLCVWAGLKVESVPMLTGALVGMVFFGVAHGLITAVANPTIARYFGRTHHGSIRGTVGMVIVVGTGLGPLTSAWGFDLGGESFGPVLIGYAIVCVPLVMAGALLAKPRAPGENGRSDSH